MHTKKQVQSQSPQRASSTTPSSSTRVHGYQQQSLIWNLQHSIGNQAVLRLMRAKSQSGESAAGLSAADVFGRTSLPLTSPAIMQPKLTINAPGDIFEQEADRVTEQVMGMPAAHAAAAPVTGAATGAQRKSSGGATCADCQRCDNEQQLQMKSAAPNGSEHATAPPIVHEVLHSPGRPLDAATRAFMGLRFGQDFRHVRVHTDTKAAESARALQARAYTVGQDVVFGAGQFAPRTQAGQRLLSHELTHVVQQSDPGKASRSRDVSSQVMLQRSPETGDDTDFEKNYIDNNIVLATGLAIPGTTWENIDHDRIPQMKLTYKDGRTLIVDVKDIPLQLHVSPGPPRGPRTVNALLPPRYEKRSDGFIYPIRAGDVSYADANNIMSLRAGLHDEIEELKLGFQLIQAGAQFGNLVSMLGGFAAMNHAFARGGLFEPIPKKQAQAKPVSKSPPPTAKPTTVPGPPKQTGESGGTTLEPQPTVKPAPATPPTKPMKAPPGGGPRGTVTATQKTITSSKPSNPVVTKVVRSRVPQIAMGDVKSIDGYKKGIRHISEMEGRGKYNTNGNIGIALYDRKNGQVTLQVLGPASPGQPRKIIFEGPIGTIEIPEGLTEVQIGNAVEEPVRNLVRLATGQDFPSKRPNAPGPDLTTPK